MRQDQKENANADDLNLMVDYLSTGEVGADHVIPTPWLVLNDGLQGGLFRKHLVAVASRPGTGRSVFAQNVSLGAAKEKIPTLLFSPSIPRNELMLRTIANMGSIQVRDLREANLSDQDWDKVAQQVKIYNGYPLTVVDTPRLTLEAISKISRETASEQNLGLIVLDGLQDLSRKSSYEHRYTEISDDFHELKRLAHELNVAMLVTSPLNRAAEARMTRKPQLEDIRIAGDLDDAADAVVLLHREDQISEHRPGELDLILAKNRHGRTQTVTVSFQQQYSRIVDIQI